MTMSIPSSLRRTSTSPPERLTLINDLWEDLKVESSIGKGIYIACAVILAALAALAVCTVLRRRRWGKLY